ncbi:L-type lectin-domain containing receptor kinase IV.1-like [Humulus lupulus]|uniref:L-type lectin-domain containing receptor kinase IV.1-like n=1 Tax=Humulus lupulus TaxID=3486 RepID=UPI002B4036A3|nr:L-type lectin-domain containing receptor kinase IV.1-like [Humulus lupulus]
MISKILILLLLLSITVTVTVTVAASSSFIFNGFRSRDLELDGLAEITSNGVLRLTNDTHQKTGHAFFPKPVTFKVTPNGTVSSFSTIFAFTIISDIPNLGGHGIVFVIAPTSRGLTGARQSQYLGLFNESTIKDNAANKVVGVEFDTVCNAELADIDGNHVGIDINDLRSVQAKSASYFDEKKGRFENLSLISGKPMKVWMEYEAVKKQMNVTLAPAKAVKPRKPLLSLNKDLSPFIKDTMYIGFSSSTGTLMSNHYVLGWSFEINGEAQELDFSKLPKPPRVGPKPKSKLLTIGLPVICSSLVALVISSLVYFVRRKRKFAELIEDWELQYGPQRYKFKDLYIATKGFQNSDLLGTGGFGRVYKGVLPSKTEIAVKRISHESRQGMKEFVAEITSLGRLRHRNVLSLLGYCRRKGELLLVYDYMPNGSLDKYLYDNPKMTLNWNQRFWVIKGVASGLCYLHHEWEQVVIHRDVKASNVLLDDELNGRLGDFGLARMYEHESNPQTTQVVGTLGYLAPEHARTGKATTSSDVFAFGAFLLEVACGRRPIEGRGTRTEEMILVDWVFSCWSKGRIIEAMDSNLLESNSNVIEEEVELVLNLELFCSLSEPEVRPSMRQVVSFLERDVPLPDFSTMGLTAAGLTFAHKEGFDDFAVSYPSSTAYYTQASSYSTAESLVSGGRWDVFES